MEFSDARKRNQGQGLRTVFRFSLKLAIFTRKTPTVCGVGLDGVSGDVDLTKGDV